MLCEKCNNKLPYGARYCESCGQKISKGVYEADYNKTLWAKFDKLKDWYDRLFLKNITGSLPFKIISLAVVIVYFFFTMYGNLMGIRLNENPEYTIEYNKQADEYYVCPENDIAQLDLFVPIGTDNVVFTAVSDDETADVSEYTTEEYKNNGYTVSPGQYDFIRIDAKRGEKIADSVKIIVVSE